MPPVWNSWGCSVRGPRHIKRSQPNQDSWRARAYRWGNVIAVSDGLGSKPHSDIGSKAACYAVTEAVQYFARHPSAPVDTIPPLIHSLWRILIEPYDVRECGTTCLFAMRINERLIAGRLGDGLIFADSKSEEPVILTDEKEESFSNVTDCLNGKFHPELWELRELPADDFPRVMLCTDGISDDLTLEGRVIFPREVFANGRDMKELRRSLVEWPTPGHSDDKTLVCLVNGGEDPND
jgi:serine/threonine protein phosphatase PrpC